jgi:uncharacterized membrane protein YfcA
MNQGGIDLNALLANIDMAALLPFIAVGFAAQLVDGALGMAFGVICNTLLVGLLGVAPAKASAQVHVVKCFTGAISGLSHVLHGNVDWPLFWKLTLPAIVGGVLGAYGLTAIDAAVAKPFVLAFLSAIGLYLLWRGFTHVEVKRKVRHVRPLGFIGGFLDAGGGGGWGPVVTSNLLIQGAEPRKVIGTVNTAEFFLTVAISAAFIANIGFSDFAGATLGLLIGGVLAAPFGAWAAKHFSPRLLMKLVGVVLTLTSIYGIYHALG